MKILQNNNTHLRVGSLVVAQRTTGVCDAGERGVCYEKYTLENRPGGARMTSTHL